MKTKYSEKDIITAINWLKTRHPERATREGAIKLLNGMKVASKDIIKSLKNLGNKTEYN